MLRGSKRKGSLQVMLMAFVVLVIGITAPGYGDDDHDDGKNQDVGKYLRLSGPALEGPLTLLDVSNSMFGGTGKECRGSAGVNITLPIVSDATLARLQKPKDLEGFLLSGFDTSNFDPSCLRKDQTAGDPIVLTVVDVKTFTRGTHFITADVVLRQVVQRLHKDKDK